MHNHNVAHSPWLTAHLEIAAEGLALGDLATRRVGIELGGKLDGRRQCARFLSICQVPCLVALVAPDALCLLSVQPSEGVLPWLQTRNLLSAWPLCVAQCNA